MIVKKNSNQPVGHVLKPIKKNTYENCNYRG